MGQYPNIQYPNIQQRHFQAMVIKIQNPMHQRWPVTQ
jgi:hypothetical protein